MYELLAVALGGALGCCCRYGISRAFAAASVTFPAATLVANVLAGFLIGLFTGLDGARAMDARTKLFLTTGLLGGLSTFSTFSMETVRLWQDGSCLTAGLSVALNLGLSFAGVAAGLAVVRLLAPGRSL